MRSPGGERAEPGSRSWPVWLALVVWAAIWAALMARHGGVSWHYFDTGGVTLVDLDNPDGAIHVYATHPDLQFGPVAMVASGALSLLGTASGLIAAQLLGAIAGLAVLACVADTASSLRPLGTGSQQQKALLLAGLAFLPVWMNLAVRFVHVDDVLALTLATAAVWAAVRRWPLAAALLIGLSAASKPWALPFLVLVFALPRREWLKAFLVSWAVVAIAWLPFLVADPRSLLAAKFAIPSAAGSSLHTLGITDATTPAWDRPVQMLLGALVAAIAIRRGRWQAALLLIVGIRIVLDPGAYSYYTAGILVGALIWDLTGSSVRFPVWSWSATALLFADRWLPISAPALGWIRTLFVAACLVLLILPSARGRRTQERSILRITAPTRPRMDP